MTTELDGLVAGMEARRAVSKAAFMALVTDEKRKLAAFDDLVAALKGVIRVADRQTDEFDAARAALAKAGAA